MNNDLIRRSNLRKRTVERRDRMKKNGQLTLPSGFGVFLNLIEDAPATDAEEVVHSKWVKDRDGDEYCENCSRYMPIREVTGDPSATNYCPNCGARMDGE